MGNEIKYNMEKNSRENTTQNTMENSIQTLLQNILKKIDDKNNISEKTPEYHEDWKKNIKKENLREKYSSLEKLQQNYKNSMEFYNNIENENNLKLELEQEITMIIQKIQEYILHNIIDKKYNNFFFLEIKTGAGGVDAQDWTEMLCKMYLKFFEKNQIKYEIYDKQGDIGIKNITIKIFTPMIFFLGEVGIHRLVRISPFNAQGKRQTSFSSVYIYGITNHKKIEISPKDIRFETFRASGAGGQHVNKTDSAVRVIHNSGLVAECQNERSQQQNKEKALKLLEAKLYLQKIQREKEEAKLMEKTDVTWGQQFRSYVLDPYKNIKDSRIHMEINSNIEVQNFLNGQIQNFLNHFFWLSITDEKYIAL